VAAAPDILHDGVTIRNELDCDNLGLDAIVCLFKPGLILENKPRRIKTSKLSS